MNIVETLRNLANGLVPLAEQHALRNAANEIERLDSALQSCLCEKVLLQEELEKALMERDEARREVCALDADTSEDQREYATQRGWFHLFGEPKP